MLLVLVVAVAAVLLLRTPAVVQRRPARGEAPRVGGARRVHGRRGRGQALLVLLLVLLLLLRRVPGAPVGRRGRDAVALPRRHQLVQQHLLTHQAGREALTLGRRRSLDFALQNTPSWTQSACNKRRARYLDVLNVGLNVLLVAQRRPKSRR